MRKNIIFCNSVKNLATHLWIISPRNVCLLLLSTQVFCLHKFPVYYCCIECWWSCNIAFFLFSHFLFLWYICHWKTQIASFCIPAWDKLKLSKRSIVKVSFYPKEDTRCFGRAKNLGKRKDSRLKRAVNSSNFIVDLASCWRGTFVAASKPHTSYGLIQFLWWKCLLWLVIVEWGGTRGCRRTAETCSGKNLKAMVYIGA